MSPGPLGSVRDAEYRPPRFDGSTRRATVASGRDHGLTLGPHSGGDVDAAWSALDASSQAEFVTRYAPPGWLSRRVRPSGLTKDQDGRALDVLNAPMRQLPPRPPGHYAELARRSAIALQSWAAGNESRQRVLRELRSPGTHQVMAEAARRRAGGRSPVVASRPPLSRPAQRRPPRARGRCGTHGPSRRPARAAAGSSGDDGSGDPEPGEARREHHILGARP